jgi:hypothetical protein
VYGILTVLGIILVGDIKKYGQFTVAFQVARGRSSEVGDDVGIVLNDVLQVLDADWFSLLALFVASHEQPTGKLHFAESVMSRRHYIFPAQHPSSLLTSLANIVCRGDEAIGREF